MDVNTLQGTNPVFTGGSPVQQPLNQNADFLGFPTFKDWFDNWLETMYGSAGNPTGATQPIAGQVDVNKDLGLIANNSPYSSYDRYSNPTGEDNSDDYSQIYSWIYEAIENAKTNNEENWYRQALWDYDRYLEEVKRVEAREDSSYQRAVEDLKKAGINPLLAFNSLSGAGSSSVNPSTSSYINNNSLTSSLLSTILGDKKIGLALIEVFTGLLGKLLPGIKLVSFMK